MTTGIGRGPADADERPSAPAAWPHRSTCASCRAHGGAWHVPWRSRQLFDVALQRIEIEHQARRLDLGFAHASWGNLLISGCPRARAAGPTSWAKVGKSM